MLAGGDSRWNDSRIIEMRYNITVYNEDAFFKVDIMSNVNLDRINVMLSDIVRHKRWRQGLNILLDYSRARMEHLTPTDIVSLADLFRSYSDMMADSKLAMVLTSDVNYGLGRMWQAYTASHISCEIGVFRNMDEAKFWLVGDNRKLKSINAG